MSKKKQAEIELTRRPATTVEARENELILLSMAEAERRIRNHTASSQIITHYLKLGTTNADLERQKLINENLLLQAKANNIAASEHNEKMYEEAVNAFKIYSGNKNTVSDDEAGDIIVSEQLY